MKRVRGLPCAAGAPASRRARLERLGVPEQEAATDEGHALDQRLAYYRNLDDAGEDAADGSDRPARHSVWRMP